MAALSSLREKYLQQSILNLSKQVSAAVKVHVVAKVTIDASPADVFKYLTNLKYHFLWNPHLRKVSSVKTLKLGTEYRSASMLLGVKVEGRNLVTKFSKNQEFELENKTSLIRYKVNHALRAQGDKTLLTCTTSVYTDNEIFNFAKSVPRLLARRELQADLQSLKIAVEQHLK